MIPLTLGLLSRATGADLVGPGAPDELADVEVWGPVSTDSRVCGPGGLYVARRGEHADGHDYAPQAVAAGAVAVLGERPVEGVPTLVTDDVQAFLEFADRAHQPIGVQQLVPAELCRSGHVCLLVGLTANAAPATPWRRIARPGAVSGT